MYSQNFVRRCTTQNLHQAIRVLVGASTRVCAERENSLLVCNACGLELFFTLTNIGDLWASVDYTWNGIVVYMATFAEDLLYCCNTLFFCFVSKHLALDYITNAVDVRHMRLPMVIDDDLTTLIHLNASVLKAKPICEGTTTDADQTNINIKFSLLIRLRVLNVQTHSTSFVVDARIYSRIKHEA